MANCREVEITGTLPFCIGDPGVAGDKALMWLGTLNLPSYGLRISYGKMTFKENEHKGRTAMYDFTVSGMEAVRVESLQDLLTCFQDAGASIYSAKCRDIENNDPWGKLI